MRKAHALTALLGVWLALSPWFGGYARHAHAMQDSMIGVLVVVASIASEVVGYATPLPVWIVLALGVWTALTPIMFAQTGQSFSADNDFVVGLLVALGASVGVVSRARALLLAGPPDPDAAKGQASLE